MKIAKQTIILAVGCAVVFSVNRAGAQDWPQWRGVHRDSKAAGFTAPKAWPKELTQKWKTAVGTGDSSPALMGDKLYVFSRQEADEIIRCLDAASGKELWADKYPVSAISGADARQRPGPRSSPAVADGKVVTLGVTGTLSCLDAATGKMLWRKDDFQGAWPRFHVASSPIILEGLVIAQLGKESEGGILAYDLATGDSKWKWMEEGPAYASPVSLTVAETKMIVTQTAKG